MQFFFSSWSKNPLYFVVIMLLPGENICILVKKTKFCNCDCEHVLILVWKSSVFCRDHVATEGNWTEEASIWGAGYLAGWLVTWCRNNRGIYIAKFAIFKIATSWSYHLHLREKPRSFSFTKLRDFLVGSAHVRSQATVHAFMHAAHAVCMRAEDIDTRFKERT